MISLDFDSVLYGLDTIAIEFIKKEYGVRLTPMDINNWDFFKKYPKVYTVFSNWELYKEAKLIDGAQEFFQTVVKNYGKENIQIVTSSPETIITDKNIMIENLFSFDNVIHSYNKSKHTKGTILVDDALHNIECHVNTNNNHGLLFDLGYGWNQLKLENHPLVKRVKSYEETLIELDKIIKENYVKTN
jgi:hypothetical protein